MFGAPVHFSSPSRVYPRSGHQDGPDAGGNQEPNAPEVDWTWEVRVTPQAFVAALGRWTEGAGPVYRRLAAAIRASIGRGEIRAGERLPSERALAARLAVSRTTVVAAYDDLRKDRWIESRQGSGTRVRGCGVSPPGAAAARGPVGLLPPPSGLAELHRGARRSDRVSRRAPAGAGHPRARGLAHRREGAARSRAQSRVPSDGPAGAPAGDRAPPLGLRPRDERGPGSGHARRPAGDRARRRASRGARRVGRRRGPDLPRVDRHLRRPGRAPRDRAGRG